MRKSLRRAAIATTLLSAAIPLTSGTAEATVDFVVTTHSSTPDGYGCALTTESCTILVSRLTAFTSPVTVTVDGTPLGTFTPADGCCDRYQFIWTPQKPGTYTVTAQVGTQTAATTVTVVDYNSLQGILRRYVGS